MNRVIVTGELVTFRNPENYLLDGILYESGNSIYTIIHIHGSYGNFYQNPFLRHMAKAYTEAGYNFLSFNMRSHDGFAEGYQNTEDFEYVGAAVSDYNTFLLDIEGAIDFVSSFSKKIILQGHSMGCDKVVEYMLLKMQYYDCILLSPSDSYMLQSNWINRQHGISVEGQIKQLEDRINWKDNTDFDWLPIDAYGLYYTDDPHFLPISSKALLSILKGASFNIFNLENPRKYFINSNCLVYIGGSDELQTWNDANMFSFLQERFKMMTPLYIKEAEHMIEGYEKEVCDTITKWLNTL